MARRPTAHRTEMNRLYKQAERKRRAANGLFPMSHISGYQTDDSRPDLHVLGAAMLLLAELTYDQRAPCLRGGKGKLYSPERIMRWRSAGCPGRFEDFAMPASKPRRKPVNRRSTAALMRRLRERLVFYRDAEAVGWIDEWLSENG